MPTILIYVLAALAEIGGCFAFWAWLRLGRSVLWLMPGLLSLAAFAWLLALVPTDQAGREIGADGQLAFLRDAFDLRRPRTEADRGDEAERHGAATLRCDGHVLDRRQFLPRGLVQCHTDRDLTVA